MAFTLPSSSACWTRHAPPPRHGAGKAMSLYPQKCAWPCCEGDRYTCQYASGRATKPLDTTYFVVSKAVDEVEESPATGARAITLQVTQDTMDAFTADHYRSHRIKTTRSPQTTRCSEVGPTGRHPSDALLNQASTPATEAR